MTLEQLSITLNEIRLAYPKIKYREFTEIAKLHKIPYYAFLIKKFVDHNVIRKEGVEYIWNNEPLHIKKLELIIKESREIACSSNNRRRDEFKSMQSKVLDIESIITSVEGYSVVKSEEPITHDMAIKIAKVLGWKIYKEI